MMENIDESLLLEELDTGFLFVDQKGLIRIMNSMARSIIGLTHESDVKHPSGKIETGDIVLLGTNMLGNDDGDLTEKDLERVGIRSIGLERDSSLVAIGIYEDDTKEPIFQLSRRSIATGELSTECTLRGKRLSSTIDFERRRIVLGVDEDTFSMNYLISTGNIVILDGKDLSLKFYQAKGYSYRDEAIGELLRGQSFQSKGYQCPAIEPLGEEITHFFGPCEFVDQIYRLLETDHQTHYEDHYFIKARNLLCRLKSIHGESTKGVMISLSDVSEWGDLFKTRNFIIEQMEKRVQSILPRCSKDLSEVQNIQGNSTLMQEVKFLIKKATKVNSTVLITGESGTGKTLIAREIHRMQYPEEPFVEVNCGSIPQGLFESELFGYTPGSFTDALKKGKKGLFEKAGKGTIFLDEITEIPVELQGKLLHVIQDKRFYPIGATEPVQMKARIIAATNRDIREQVRLKHFREDLYYRLNVFPIRVPPLRDRMIDVYYLVNHILDDLRKRYAMDQKMLSNDAYERILEHSWPGNVRELENILERALLVSEGTMIYPEHLDISIEDHDLSLSSVREAAEKRAIQQALLRTKDKKELMKMLEISKSSLYEKMKAYDLDFL